MQLLIEHTDGDDVVEVQVKQAAALHVVTPLVLRGHGRSSLAAALEGVQRSGVPCIVEEPSGHAAELANHLDLVLDEHRAGFEGEWTIAVWVGEGALRPLKFAGPWLIAVSGGSATGTTDSS